MGAMLYEMAYGIAPFFSREIRHTYVKIMEHHVSPHVRLDTVRMTYHNDRGV